MMGPSTRIGRTALALLAATAIAAGCTEQSPTGPSGESDGAPVLPDAAWLAFDTSFFGQTAKNEALSKRNYTAAAFRVGILTLVADFVLTPPIAAFALAHSTFPSPQPDGSWIWVYTWVNGDEEVQVRLRGLATEEGAEWEMRITDLAEETENELWFDGETEDDGHIGSWTFYDFQETGKPAVATIDWENSGKTSELVFTDLYEHPGNELSYAIDGTSHSIDFYNKTDDESSFIHWDAVTGAGSILVPDYNDGEKACWDENQLDIDCGEIS